MRAVSAALATAIMALARRPTHRVRVDWDHDGGFDGDFDDVSHQVESISITQELTTDLPEAAKLLTGYATGRATVVLGAGTQGDPAEHAAWMYSPYNEQSPLFGKRRLRAPVSIEQGFLTSGGPERIPTFTGQVRSVEVSSGSRTATVQCLDNRERLRCKVTLPVVVADDLDPGTPSARKAGLSSQWVIDYILRHCGFFATPGTRAHNRLSATLLGSAWPEIGTLVRSTRRPVFTADGWVPNSSDPPLFYDLSIPVSVNDGSQVFVELWLRPGHDTQFWKLETEAADEPDHPFVSLGRSGTTLQLMVDRPGPLTPQTLDGPTVDLSARGYVGVHITFGASAITAQWRVDGVSTTTTAATSSVTTSAPLTRMRLGAEFFQDVGSPAYSGLQVTTETYSAAMWNDGFTPTAFLDVSLNELIGIPPVKGADAWQTLQDVALAEFGLLLLDEHGLPHFRNRNWRDRPASATVQRTLTTSTSIKELGSSESIDSVRNRVTVRAQPVALSRFEPAWSAADIYRVPAAGSLSVWAEFDGAVFNLDTSVTFSPLGGQQGSGYRASELADGSGPEVSNLGFTVEQFVDTALVVISNPNAFDAFLVQPVGYPNAGRPAFSLWAQVLKQVTADMDHDGTSVQRAVPTSPRLAVEASDAASMALYGDQPLDLPANKWRQDATDLLSLAADLVSYLKNPMPTLTNLSVVGDPRLQLCDRVLIRDPAGLVFQGEFHLTGIATTQSASAGLTQQINARAVLWGPVPNEYDVDAWDYAHYE